MLKVVADNQARSCDGATRREFLKVGSLGIGGLSLPWLLRARAEAAAAGMPVKQKSVVMIFCSGGISHIETFDPKPTGPVEFRSMTGDQSTSLPGVAFGGTFENLARLAHRMAVVRSFAHKEGNHPKAIEQVFTCGNETGASLGTIMSRLRGTSHPLTGMPSHVHLYTDEVDNQYNNEKGRMIKADGPGTLGAAYSPFYPAGTGQVNQNMELRLPMDRLDSRRALRRSLDRLNHAVDASGNMAGLDTFEQQAFDLILGKSRDAFDLHKEDPRLLARYDSSSYQTGHKKLRPSELGRQLLLARRLCEAGCGFITIQNPGWDMHADGNNPGILKGMEMLGRPLDHAVGVFLEDLAARGMADDVLLVITGDFGRTPKINARGGRDHWPSLSTLCFAGGGLKMGQVIGQSGSKADAPASEPIGLDHLLATVLHALFDVGQLRLLVNIPRPIAQILERAEPIRDLV